MSEYILWYCNKQFIYFLNRPVIFGREDVDYIIDESVISRQHFSIETTSEGLTVKDLGSSNGTKVNGLVLPQDNPLHLVEGDIISVRECCFVVIEKKSLEDFTREKFSEKLSSFSEEMKSEILKKMISFLKVTLPQAVIFLKKEKYLSQVESLKEEKKITLSKTSKSINLIKEKKKTLVEEYQVKMKVLESEYLVIKNERSKVTSKFNEETKVLNDLIRPIDSELNQFSESRIHYLPTTDNRQLSEE